VVRIRPNVREIVPYQPGKPEDEVARELGLSEIVKLASNECPLPPFPEVFRVMSEHLAGVNRYPDNDRFHLTGALAAHLAVPEESVWCGAGSTELLMCIATAVGGEGTSMVYAWPSFVMYRIAARVTGSQAVEVPLDGEMRHDPEAIVGAVRPDTAAVFVCNPNNPTGTHISAKAVSALVDALSEDVLVVVDEAYHEYVRADDYGSMVALAVERPNVLVTRTFSKVYGLAGLRVGYAVGRGDVVTELRKVQAPFTVSDVAQAAAVEALRHPARVAERVRLNAAGIDLLHEELTRRRIVHCESQTNFVFLRLGEDETLAHQLLLRRGVIVRPLSGGWLRVTVGTEPENRRFLGSLDAVLSDANLRS
jgi:histidinol-phosphate aminotransferase